MISLSKKYIFAVDLGGTGTKMAILNLEGEIVHKWDIPTDTSENGKNVVPNLAKSFHEKLEEWKLSKDDFLGVGMGAPGPVVDGGIISRAVNVGWENYPLKNELEEHLGFPAFIDNDANCAAQGEMWKGAGMGYHDLIFITLGTGVGGGIIANGNIVNGTNGAGGEIGHMTVQLDNGYPCNCGKQGCLESVASATGIVRLAMDHLKGNSPSERLKEIYEKNGSVTSKDVFDLAKEGDEGALAIAERMAFYLGYAIGAMSTALNPKAVILGGGVSKAGETLVKLVDKYYRKFAFPPAVDDTTILLATLGNDAGVIGAGYLVKKNLG